MALVGTPGACTQVGSATAVNPAFSVPYPVGDPVPNPPVRALLARSPWVVVDPGDDAAGLHRPVPKSMPHVLGSVLDVPSDPATTLQLHRMAWGSKRAGWDPVPLDPVELQPLGIVAPAEHVWLFGPEGPCRARVGQPRLSVYAGAGDVYEISWELQGCTGVGWAPVGLLAEQVPADVRWVAAETLAELELQPQERWEHPLEDLVDHPKWDVPPDGRIVWARSILELTPSPTQVLSSVWAAGPEQAPCQQAEETVVTHGLWDEVAFEPVDPLPDPERVVVLLGAIAQGDRPEAIVFADGLEGWVAVPPAPTQQELQEADREQEADDAARGIDPGPRQWTSIPLETGTYADWQHVAATYSVRAPECDG